MAAPTLARLIERAGLEALIASARAVAPDLQVRLLDPDGVEVFGAGSAPAAGGPTRTRPIIVDGSVLGTLELTGPGSASPVSGGSAEAIAELIGRSVELAARAGLGRREVTAAAIDDLRELALLSRLSADLGAAVDAAGIADSVLSTVSRPLGPAVGIVYGPDDRTILAASGAAIQVAGLTAAAEPLVNRLRAEDPVIGSCAETEGSPDSRFGTILAAYLRTARGHHGTIVLGRPAGGEPFSAADRQLLASVAGQAAVAIERASLQQIVADRRAMDQELAIGRRIQISLMPRRFPAIPGWEIASAYEPAREVGGDFYDVFRLRDRPDCLGLVVADVTGKGIPAAILMADTRGLIHAAADHGSDPADTLGRVNRILVSERASGLFVTVAHATLDARTGRLVLARAGHDPVHVLRADGRLDVLDPPGRLIGMVADLELTSVEVTLDAGDAFVGHTDGVTEARSAGGAFYGEDRFRALLGSLAGATAAAIVDAVAADVTSFRDGAEPSDDLTLLVVRRAAAAAALLATDGNVDLPETGSSSS